MEIHDTSREKANPSSKVSQFQLADIKVAEIHGRSRKIYLNLLSKDSIDQNELFNITHCPCCGFPAEGQNFSYFCQVHDLAQLGSSFPLFFKYCKYLLISLTIVLCLACIATLADNASQGNYSEWTREKSINVLTPANFGDPLEASFWQPILHVAACSLLVFFYAWIIRNIKEHSVDYDTNVTTPSDFTVMVKNLPVDYTKNELQEHIEQNFMLKNFKIVSINCTYDVQEYVECRRLLEDYRSQLLLVKGYEEKHGKPLVVRKMCKKIELEGPVECEKMIKQLEEQEVKLKAKMDTDKLAPIAFVTFNSQTNARLVASEWGRTNVQIIFDQIFSYFVNKRHWFKGNYIHAEMAPDHSDINWEHLAVSRKSKWLKRSISILLALLVLCAASGIMAGTSKWKASVYKNKESESGDSIRAATIIPSIITIITNFTVARVIRLLANKEKYSTWTDYNRAVLNKLIIFYLLNNIGIPMFVYSDPDNEWFSPGGLAYTVFWLQIMNCWVSPVMYLINPKNLFKKLQRFSLKRAEKQADVRVSQKVANLAFEGPEIDLADRFANLTKIFTMSLFFSPLVPIGVPIGIVGLALEAGIFKYMLINVHCKPKWYNSDLVIRAAEWMRWGLFMYSIGILVFYQKLVSELWPLELFFFVAMAIYVFTPISTVCICCFKDRTLEIIERQFEGDSKHDNFFTYLPKFLSDFERENPVTKEEGLERWENFMIAKDPSFYLPKAAEKEVKTNKKDDGVAGKEIKTQNKDHDDFKDNHDIYPSLENVGKAKSDYSNSGYQDFGIPGVGNSGSGYPAISSASGNPGIVSSESGYPGIVNTGSGYPGIVNPGSGQPGNYYQSAPAFNPSAYPPSYPPAYPDLQTPGESNPYPSYGTYINNQTSRPYP